MGKKSIGFIQKGEVKSSKEKRTVDILQKLELDDLVKFGMIPEFVGRIPVTAALESLDEDALVEILTKPRNAIVKQYQKLLGMDNIELEFTDGAIRALAKEAYRRKTGARALRGIVEELMLDVMYEIPSREDVGKCTITEEMVEKRSTAELIIHPASYRKPESAY